MTPFSFLQFITFAAWVTLLIPLRFVAAACAQEAGTSPAPFLFYEPAFFLFGATVACASVVWAFGSCIPAHPRWRRARSLLVHILLMLGLGAGSFAVIAQGVGSDAFRLGSAAVAFGFAIHTLAIPLGPPPLRTPDDAVSVPFLSASNTNRFLNGVVILVITYHVLFGSDDLIKLLRALWFGLGEYLAR